MGKYKEPWEYESYSTRGHFSGKRVVDCEGRLIAGNMVTDRIVACVNALADIDDPEAFMKAVRGSHTHPCEHCGQHYEEQDNACSKCSIGKLKKILEAK